MEVSDVFSQGDYCDRKDRERPVLQIMKLLVYV